MYTILKLKTRIILLGIVSFVLIASHLQAQDDGRYSITYQTESSGKLLGTFEENNTKSSAHSIGLHRLVRFGHSTMFSVGLEYNLLRTGLQDESGSNINASSVAFLFGARQSALLEHLYYGLDFVFEYDFGIPDNYLYHPNNGFGMQLSLLYDIHINDNIVISPMIGLKGRGLVYFRERAQKPRTSPWDREETKGEMRVSRRLGIHLAYKIF